MILKILASCNEVMEITSYSKSRMYREMKEGTFPINIKKVGMRALKLLLLELCIREAKWAGKHANSLKLQSVPIEEFSQTFDYGLKDITKLDDFNQVVDWESSSFYQASNHLSSSIK